MTTLKVTQAVIIKGQHYPVGSLVTLDEKESQLLRQFGQAVDAEALAEEPSPMIGDELPPAQHDGEGEALTKEPSPKKKK